MIRRPQRSTRNDTLCPYTTLFRSAYVQVPHSLNKWRSITWHTPKKGWRTGAAKYSKYLLSGSPEIEQVRRAASEPGLSNSRTSDGALDRKSTRLNSSH